jgi:hypothetical protein
VSYFDKRSWLGLAYIYIYIRNRHFTKLNSNVYNYTVRVSYVLLCYFIILFRNEHRFLVAGLKIEKMSDWAARQAAYNKAVKEFLTKLKPEFATEVDVKFVRAVSLGRGQEARLFLSVDCGNVEQ